MIHVLVTLNRGIFSEVLFYFDRKDALKALAGYVKDMDTENDDAAVFSPEGLIANAKTFLDDEDLYDPSMLEELLKSTDDCKPIYVIGNPTHFLGFMIASFDEPMGYTNLVEAVSDIGVLRRNHGKHLKLYRLIPVTDAVVQKADVEKYNAENEINDFDPKYAKEYMN